MAGAEWKPANSVLCRYFIHGVCREGESCRYSHSTNDSQQSVCKFYQKGCCTYGDKCRYDHVKPKLTASVHSHGSSSSCIDRVSSSHRSNATPSSSQTAWTGVLATPSKPKPVLLPKGDDLLRSGMVSLTKQAQSSDSGLGEDTTPVPSPMLKNADEWAKAPEFVPGQPYRGALPPSYLKMAQSGIENVDVNISEEDKSHELCPYAAHGECWYGENCVYVHGDTCDLCGKSVMHPTNQELRDKHTMQCVKEHEQDMELSFAIQRSNDKVCGICMEVVWEKKPVSERKFGILSDCNHVFCLSCIRKWRSNKQFESKTIRSCPECRIASNFVTPSKYWIQDKVDKEKLIDGYKQVLSSKPCKYFDQGRSDCPFNENCFYLHAYPDGKKASPKPKKRRHRQNANGDLDFIQQIILWDFLEDRENRLALDMEELDAVLFHSALWDTSSDDDSDLSDFDI